MRFSKLSKDFMYFGSNFLFLGTPSVSKCIFTGKEPLFCVSATMVSNTVNNLSNSVSSIHGYFSVLHVKGIGFKVYYYSKLNALYFSLGYNHLVKYRLADNILVKVRKQYILMFSYNKQDLGTTICQIRRLRYPDVYRGKGIRFRFQSMNFKPGKQR